MKTSISNKKQASFLSQYLSALIKEEALLILNEALSAPLKDIFDKYYKRKLTPLIYKQFPNGGVQDQNTHEFKRFNRIINADPTTIPDKKMGKYSKWILNYWMDRVNDHLKEKYRENLIDHFEGRFFEDSDKLKEYLYVYDKLKLSGKLPKEYIDINKIPNPGTLYQIIKPFKDEFMISNIKELEAKSLADGETEHVFSGDIYDVYIPKTERAACIFGAGTEWCTASGQYSLNPDKKSQTNYFNGYNERAPLYILINKSDPNDKFQFFFDPKYAGDDQFMDINDDPVGMADILIDDLKVAKALIDYDPLDIMTRHFLFHTDIGGGFADRKIAFNEYNKRFMPLIELCIQYNAPLPPTCDIYLENVDYIPFLCKHLVGGYKVVGLNLMSYKNFPESINGALSLLDCHLPINYTGFPKKITGTIYLRKTGRDEKTVAKEILQHCDFNGEIKIYDINMDSDNLYRTVFKTKSKQAL